MDLAFAGLTDTGRVRARNEDALLLRPERALFAVADGMGGHAGGDVASRIAVDVLDERLLAAGPAPDDRDLDAAIRAAHDAILRAARAEPALAGMGTTLTALVLPPDGPLIGHVGDSRAYRFRQGAIAQLTRDQTWVQDEMDAGRLTHDQARHHPFGAVITSALGIDERTLDVRIVRPEVRAGDVLLLCSDGLVARLDDDDLATLLAPLARPDLADRTALEDAARALVDAANEAGGPDNVTVALVRPAP